jgi:hypothetical protein
MGLREDMGRQSREEGQSREKDRAVNRGNIVSGSRVVTGGKSETNACELKVPAQGLLMEKAVNSTF